MFMLLEIFMHVFTLRKILVTTVLVTTLETMQKMTVTKLWGLRNSMSGLWSFETVRDVCALRNEKRTN